MQTLKQQAGAYAAQFVESGMVIGLGTGSTAIFATRRIAQRIQSGDLRDIIAIPTSLATESMPKDSAFRSARSSTIRAST